MLYNMYVYMCIYIYIYVYAYIYIYMCIGDFVIDRRSIDLLTTSIRNASEI